MFHVKMRRMYVLLFLGGMSCTYVVTFSFTGTLYFFLVFELLSGAPSFRCGNTPFSILCRTTNKFFQFSFILEFLNFFLI